MNKFITALILVVSINFSFAQYGWTHAEIHLKNGKTLNGEAKLKMMSAGLNLAKEKLKFRSKDKKNKKKFSPEEVEYVIFTINPNNRDKKNRVRKSRTEKYIPVFLNKNRTNMGFVELMVDGKLRLVGRTVVVNSGGGWVHSGSPNSAPVYTPGFMGSHNQVMFLKKGKKPVVFNNSNIFKSFKKRAMEYFKDCPALKSKIENKEYKQEDLQEIVKFYNSSCVNL